MTEKKDPSKSPRDTNGPVVKTGPTAGENRSRNKDGRWRAKRSDAGKPRCFITTAACQYKGLADDCYELEVLRHFRDSYLLSTEDGRNMVNHYYSIAPALAENLVEISDFEQVWGAISDCIDAIETERYQEAVAVYKNMVLSLQQKFGA